MLHRSAGKLDRLGHAMGRPGADFRVPPPSNYIFWIGAGFSATAGIPLAEGIVDRLLDKRWRGTVSGASKLEKFSLLDAEHRARRRTEFRKWVENEKILGNQSYERWGEFYGPCLRLLPGEVDRQEFITECIEEGRGRLNIAHLFLGQLVKTKFVNTILTTNFDDLLLRALQLYFVVPSVLDPGA